MNIENLIYSNIGNKIREFRKFGKHNFGGFKRTQEDFAYDLGEYSRLFMDNSLLSIIENGKAEKSRNSNFLHDGHVENFSSLIYQNENDSEYSKERKLIIGDKEETVEIIKMILLYTLMNGATSKTDDVGSVINPFFDVEQENSFDLLQEGVSISGFFEEKHKERIDAFDRDAPVYLQLFEPFERSITSINKYKNEVLNKLKAIVRLFKFQKTIIETDAFHYGNSVPQDRIKEHLEPISLYLSKCINDNGDFLCITLSNIGDLKVKESDSKSFVSDINQQLNAMYRFYFKDLSEQELIDLITELIKLKENVVYDLGIEKRSIIDGVVNDLIKLFLNTKKHLNYFFRKISKERVKYYDKFFYSSLNHQKYELIKTNDLPQLETLPNALMKLLFSNYEFSRDFVNRSTNKLMKYDTPFFNAFIENKGSDDSIIDYNKIGYRRFIIAFDEMCERNMDVFLEFFNQNLFNNIDKTNSLYIKSVTNEKLNKVLSDGEFLNKINSIYMLEQLKKPTCYGHDYLRKKLMDDLNNN